MKSSPLQRLVLGLCAFCVLLYIGFQVYRFFDSRYVTETVYNGIVEESLKVGGIALRTEIVLEERIGSGVATYLISDGVKVSNGMPIAEIYQNTQDADNIYKIRELEHKKYQLSKAQDPGTTLYAHTDVLNKQIFKELGSVIDQINASDLSTLPDASDKLLLLLNTKQVTTGRQDNFEDAIGLLASQEQYYADRIQTEPRKILAEQAGYFIREIDGFEGEVDLTELDALTPELLSEVMLRPVKKDQSRAGKLMTDHNWYFAAVVDTDALEPFRLGRSVTLNFGISGMNPVPAVVYEVNTEKDSDKSVVIFQSDFIDESVVNLRTAQVDVAFKSVSGLRVSKEALRFEGLQQGVYIIRGDKLAFRPVNTIYEEQGFVLCEKTSAAEADYSENLQQFDEVVLKGGQLYDGKPVG